MAFGYTKACFIYRIAQKTSDILWAMLGIGWKRILNCVSWFVSIILNLNALCGAYTVQRQKLYSITQK